MDDEIPDPRGLFTRFNVTRLDGSSQPGQKHEGCEYFVLDRRHDKHAAPALAAYAQSCQAERPALARDLLADPAVEAAEMVSAEVGPDRWAMALAMAVQLYSGNTQAVLEPSVRRDFVETAVWFHINLGIPPGEGDQHAGGLAVFINEPSYEPADGDRHAYEQGDDGCTHCDADALDLIHEVG